MKKNEENKQIASSNVLDAGNHPDKQMICHNDLQPFAIF